MSSKQYLASLFFGFAVAMITGSGVAIAQATTSPAAIKLVIVGDSTVADYPKSKTLRGWGMYIGERFRDGMVQIVNLAAPGRSTKTFIAEGRWKTALAEKPDIVLIQFGHNDSHGPDKPESTNAATDYRDNLRQYIEDARAIHATPILVTPMVRRTFNAQGKFEEDASPYSLATYAAAMKAVASEKGVPVIDLYASSRALAEKLGPDGSEKLADRKGDITHFNEAGARAMADLVMQDLPRVEPRLADCLKKP